MIESIDTKEEAKKITLHESENVAIVEFTRISEEADSDSFLKEFNDLIDYFEDESTSEVIVFKGGFKAFTNMNNIMDSNFFRRWEKVLNRLEKLAKVTVAMIHGRCERLWLQLSVCLDYRIATEDSVLISSEVKEGYLPGMLPYYLTKYVSLGMARRMILKGEPISAHRAFELGLIDELYQGEGNTEIADQFLREIAPKDAMVYHLGSRLLRESYANSYETALGHYLAAQHMCYDR